MNFNQAIYLCGQCKKIVFSLKELYFVEELPGRGFCSEKCIQHFYSRVVEHFDGIEKTLRKEKKIEKEEVLKYITDRKILEVALSSPDEIWRLVNDIGEQIYSYISAAKDSNGKKFYIIVVCYIYDFSPSFVISVTATKKMEMLKEYRIGKKIDDMGLFIKESKQISETTFDVNQETILLLENKKSQILAKIIENRMENDIPFERYEEYSSCKEDTLKTPDEIYQMNDADGDLINIYIKSFEIEKEVFYYFVMCVHYQDSSSEQFVLPFFFFPSKNVEIYNLFKVGNCLEGAIKN